MRSYARQTSTFLIPRPGTTEAMDLGCTCCSVVHESETNEKQPAGMLMDPNPNCPLHGTAIEPRNSE